MGFKGYQRVVVEHWKKGKQHFHVVFNIIDPITGKTNELKWTKNKEWRISRGIEQILGLQTHTPEGKGARVWEMQRGRRSGIDPRKMRKEVTAIFRNSKIAREFIEALDKAGYALSRGGRGQLVLVDRYGDVHGLMRRIEGSKVADLRAKFPNIEQIELPSLASLVRARKPVKANKASTPRGPIDPKRVKEDVQQAYRTSKTGAEFFAKLNNKEFALGRGVKGFAVIDRNGERYNIDELLGKEIAKKLKEKFPDLDAIRLLITFQEIIRRIKGNKSIKGKSLSRKPNTKRPSFIRTFTHHSGQEFYFLPVKIFGLAAKKITRNVKYKAKQGKNKQPSKFRPALGGKKGWPPAAVADWEAWGRKNPARFFARWPELAPDGNGPVSGGGLGL